MPMRQICLCSGQLNCVLRSVVASACWSKQQTDLLGLLCRHQGGDGHRQKSRQRQQRQTWPAHRSAWRCSLARALCKVIGRGARGNHCRSRVLMTHSISRDPPAALPPSVLHPLLDSSSSSSLLAWQVEPDVACESKLLSTQMHSMGSKWPSQCRTWRLSLTANHQYHQQITNITRTAQDIRPSMTPKQQQICQFYHSRQQPTYSRRHGLLSDCRRCRHSAHGGRLPARSTGKQ